MDSSAGDGKEAAMVEKYKRLLSMARVSLEANQASLAAKDAKITELTQALENKVARAQSGSRHTGINDDSLEPASIPRNLLRRVDVDDVIWILVEFDDGEDIWVCFNSDTELNEYIQRVRGVPLVCPTSCMSLEESKHILADCEAKVERVVEEFRRYKLRSEIARKQKDEESRQAMMRSAISPGLGISSSIMGRTNKTLASDHESSKDRDPSMCQDAEGKWRIAYEKAVRENESLRNRTGDTVLTSQWRDRYDILLRERDDLHDKLRVYAKLEESGTTKSIEQAYFDLRDEYKEFRRRITSRDEQRQAELEDLKIALARVTATNGSFGGGIIGTAVTPISTYNSSNGLNEDRKIVMNFGADSSSKIRQPFHSGDVSVNERGNAGTLGESKHQYIRHMILQYLSCKEPEVKLHIENALLAIFRFTDAEKSLIQERKDSEATSIVDDLSLGNFGNFLSSVTSTVGSIGGL